MAINHNNSHFLSNPTQNLVKITLNLLSNFQQIFFVSIRIDFFVFSSKNNILMVSLLDSQFTCSRSSLAEETVILVQDKKEWFDYQTLICNESIGKNRIVSFSL